MSARLCLIALLSLTAQLVATAQDSASRGRQYPVTFVCGRRPKAAGGIPGFDAVSPGFYYTAVNIRNVSTDSVRLHMLIATTRPDPVPGVLVPGPALTIGP